MLYEFKLHHKIVSGDEIFYIMTDMIPDRSFIETMVFRADVDGKPNFSSEIAKYTDRFNIDMVERAIIFHFATAARISDVGDDGCC